MYKELNESKNAENHSELLKLVNKRALEEKIIANTFMNTQNIEPPERPVEEPAENNPENERKMMIE